MKIKTGWESAPTLVKARALHAESQNRLTIAKVDAIGARTAMRSAYVRAFTVAHNIDLDGETIYVLWPDRFKALRAGRAVGVDVNRFVVEIAKGDKPATVPWPVAELWPASKPVVWFDDDGDARIERSGKIVAIAPRVELESDAVIVRDDDGKDHTLPVSALLG